MSYVIHIMFGRRYKILIHAREACSSISDSHYTPHTQELHSLEQAGLLDLEDMGNAVNKSNQSNAAHRQEVKDGLRGEG